MTYKEAKNDLIESGIRLGAGDFVDVEALKIAVVALEKQIPQKPINLSNATLDAYCAIFRCPRCKGRLKMKSKGAYCDKCGGALDWSDDNGKA